jgi:hypothetical protein
VNDLEYYTIKWPKLLLDLTPSPELVVVSSSVISRKKPLERFLTPIQVAMTYAPVTAKEAPMALAVSATAASTFDMAASSGKIQ